MKPVSFFEISSNTQKLIAGSVVLLTAFFSYQWIVSPQCSYLDAAEKRNRLEGEHHKKLTELEIKKRLYGQKIDELKAFRQDAGKRMFTQQEAEAMFSQLTPHAQSCGLKIGSISFFTTRSPTDKIDLDEMKSATIQFRSTRLQLSGSYESWIQFLDQMESTDRIVFLSRFVLHTSKSSDTLLDGEAEFSLPILLDIPETLLNPPPPVEDDEDLESEDEDYDEEY